ncbi:uncharacterized protein LOC135162202 isoform X2 [Diachasmimorpha longicaudata]|uniref:uncharacterized protein LOC135162202 isoform X2 n=1 Tax=Diachasmimorpha longicaudata TaxID=58733 RepID=UPI0030B87A90
MESKNNKETINLLDLLSESDSDISDLVLTVPKKRRIKRRQRAGVRGKTKDSCSCNKSKTTLITTWIAAVLITMWLITLSWLAAILYREIGRMDISIKSVDFCKIELFPPFLRINVKRGARLPPLLLPHL